MNRTSFFTVFACIGLMLFFACERKYQGKLTPMLDNSSGKWGYVDTLGKNVIAPKWDMANNFSEGLAVVGLNNRYGYIDEKGVEVIPIKFDSTGSFSNNIALVSLNDKWGFIDKTGIAIIPIKYDKVSPFSEGLSEVELDGKIGSIDTTGAIIVPFQNIGMEADSPLEVISEFLKRFNSGDDFMSLFSVDINETKVREVLKNAGYSKGNSVMFFNSTSESTHTENVTKIHCMVTGNSAASIGIGRVFSVGLSYDSKRNKYLITDI